MNAQQKKCCPPQTRNIASSPFCCTALAGSFNHRTPTVLRRTAATCTGLSALGHDLLPGCCLPSCRLKLEIQPLLERLDPLHFGLMPEDHPDLEALAHWENEEYWNLVMAQWQANRPSLEQVDEMYSLHAQVGPIQVHSNFSTACFCVGPWLRRNRAFVEPDARQGFNIQQQLPGLPQTSCMIGAPGGRPGPVLVLADSWGGCRIRTGCSRPPPPLDWGFLPFPFVRDMISIAVVGGLPSHHHRAPHSQQQSPLWGCRGCLSMHRESHAPTSSKEAISKCSSCHYGIKGMVCSAVSSSCPASRLSQFKNDWLCSGKQQQQQQAARRVKSLFCPLCGSKPQPK